MHVRLHPQPPQAGRSGRLDRHRATHRRRGRRAMRFSVRSRSSVAGCSPRAARRRGGASRTSLRLRRWSLRVRRGMGSRGADERPVPSGVGHVPALSVANRRARPGSATCDTRDTPLDEVAARLITEAIQKSRRGEPQLAADALSSAGWWSEGRLDQRLRHPGAPHHPTSAAHAATRSRRNGMPATSVTSLTRPLSAPPVAHENHENLGGGAHGLRSSYSSARALCSTAGALLADRVPSMPSSGAPLSPIPRSPAGRGRRRRRSRSGAGW
jgi:hypothetical protein